MSEIEPPLVERIRSVLLRDWDPVGIGFNARLRDDYDEFIPRIMAAIERGSDAAELTALLSSLETEMRAPIDHQARARAAAALVSLR